MAFQEALNIIVKKDKLNEKSEQIIKSSTSVALKYLFDCFNRVDNEERQYPKVSIYLNHKYCRLTMIFKYL